ncbi:MAK10-like protein [Tanacetum coccineum]
MASQDARLSKFEADSKQQQSEMTNKINTFLKAINDQMTGSLPSDTVKNLKLNVNSTSLDTKIKESEQTLKDEFKDLHPNLLVLEVLVHALMYNVILDKYVESLELGKNGSAFIQCEMPKKIKDPGLFTSPCRLGDSKPFDTLDDFGSCVNLIPLYLFKNLKIGLLEETDHVFGLANETNSYAVGIVKNVEFHIERLKLLEEFYVIDMEKDPATPLLIGKGFLATASALIDCKKAKIAVRERVSRLVFGVKEIDLRGKEVPYWTTLDAELNPFKDVLVFRKMVEFLGGLPINLKGNMWELEELIKEKIEWNKPLKERDGTWHIRIELIDPDGERFKKTFQSVPTTRKLFEKENPSEIIDLDHLHDL